MFWDGIEGFDTIERLKEMVTKRVTNKRESLSLVKIIGTYKVRNY